MKHLIRFKWFYSTLGFWFFLCAISAWAIIYSPLDDLPRGVSEFQSKINGISVTNVISTSPLPLPTFFRETSNRWKSQGWISASGSANVASLLLGLSTEDEKSLYPFLQLSVYKKEDRLRLLGLYSNVSDGKTYLWTAETSAEGLTPKGSLPTQTSLKPPPGAYNVFSASTPRMEIFGWSTRSTGDGFEKFIENYYSQGFSGRLLGKNGNESYFRLQRGSAKLWAVASRHLDISKIYLMQPLNE